MSYPPCTRYDPRMFDSTQPNDHAQAKAICAICPFVQSCIQRAVSISAEHSPGVRRGPDGTWGGLLWVSGSVRVPKLAPCGTPAGYWRHRTNNERPCADCRATRTRKEVA